MARKFIGFRPSYHIEIILEKKPTKITMSSWIEHLIALGFQAEQRRLHAEAKGEKSLNNQSASAAIDGPVDNPGLRRGKGQRFLSFSHDKQPADPSPG